MENVCLKKERVDHDWLRFDGYGLAIGNACQAIGRAEARLGHYQTAFDHYKRGCDEDTDEYANGCHLLREFAVSRAEAGDLHMAREALEYICEADLRSCYFAAEVYLGRETSALVDVPIAIQHLDAVCQRGSPGDVQVGACEDLVDIYRHGRGPISSAPDLAGYYAKLVGVQSQRRAAAHEEHQAEERERRARERDEFYEKLNDIGDRQRESAAQFLSTQRELAETRSSMQREVGRIVSQAESQAQSQRAEEIQLAQRRERDASYQHCLNAIGPAYVPSGLGPAPRGAGLESARGRAQMCSDPWNLCVGTVRQLASADLDLIRDYVQHVFDALMSSAVSSPPPQCEMNPELVRQVSFWCWETGGTRENCVRQLDLATATLHCAAANANWLSAKLADARAEEHRLEEEAKCRARYAQ